MRSERADREGGGGMNRSGYARCPKCGGELRLHSYCGAVEDYRIDPETGEEEERVDFNSLGETDWVVRCIGMQVGGPPGCGWAKWSDGPDEGEQE